MRLLVRFCIPSGWSDPGPGVKHVEFQKGPLPTIDNGYAQNAVVTDNLGDSLETSRKDCGWRQVDLDVGSRLGLLDGLREARSERRVALLQRGPFLSNRDVSRKAWQEAD